MPKETALTDAQIATELKALPGWRHETGALRRTYKTDGWPTTLMLVNAIGFYAEAADHHPDLEVHWGSVSVALSTHSAGGITAKDVALARQFEQTALWQAGPPFRPAEKFVRKG
ncbi:MAG TPA: 4a-hydroxytetrahydrobiopterin dehydratase [Gemmatimonadales bacterium]